MLTQPARSPHRFSRPQHTLFPHHLSLWYSVIVIRIDVLQLLGLQSIGFNVASQDLCESERGDNTAVEAHRRDEAISLVQRLRRPSEVQDETRETARHQV